MNIDDKIASLKKLSEEGRFEIYYGMDGYTIPLTRRIELAKSPIKQIVNGKAVAEFHKMTNDLVKSIIAKRAEKGLEFKNLIKFEDKDLAIEISNPATLKETRFLPKGFETNSMIAIFGETVTITSLEVGKAFGIIITDPMIASVFDSMFDSIWNISTPV